MTPLRCRVSLLGPALVRVLHLHDGDERLGARGACSPTAPTKRPGHTAALTFEITLDPFGLTWKLPDGRTDHDDGAFADSDELMLGPFLLGAPVVQPGEDARTLYLPAGPECGFDFHTGDRHASRTAAIVPAPLHGALLRP